MIVDILSNLLVMGTVAGLSFAAGAFVTLWRSDKAWSRELTSITAALFELTEAVKALQFKMDERGKPGETSDG